MVSILSPNGWEVVKLALSRYNRCVRLRHLHDWGIAISEARDLQNRLASEVCRTGDVIEPCSVAGIDVSVDRYRGWGTAAVVVLGYPGLEMVGVEVVQGSIDFPYVPGLLSFRESPLIIEACERLSVTPDLVFVDGQGIAHPRRFGIAAHLGLLLDIPTIGCAKSRLCGTHRELGIEAGCFEELTDDNETIGVALRTRHGTMPVYVSIGHKIGLEEAIYWVMKCCRGYRLPEPTRLAHQVAGGNLNAGT
ncbi:MAG: deoxyribonuclease V [Dehalococcoidales bacterium]|nr:deoxyribonuclease V [Dehalococcoidales bacterium]